MLKLLREMFVLAFMLSTMSAYSQFSGGDGTPLNSFLISTPEDLNNIRNFSSSWFRMTNDIDLSDYLSEENPGYNDGSFWEPIGNSENPFKGDFNGGGYKIINMKINRPSTDGVGFIGYGDSCYVFNLSIVIDPASSITGRNYTAGLAGYNHVSYFNTCSVSGEIIGEDYSGGLAGYAYCSHIEICSATINMYSYSSCKGGLVGFCDSGTEIIQCFTTGNLYGNSYIGGLAGFVCKSSCIYYSYSSVDILGSDATGGFIGYIESTGSKIEGCYSKGTVGSITGDNIGGFAGYACAGALITDCYSRGNASGEINVGGFIGLNFESEIINSYSTGNAEMTVTTKEPGGFCGYLDNGTVTGCYWDIETSGLDWSAGGEGKTTSEMMLKETYSGWYFEFPLWTMNIFNDGYPNFTWDVLYGFSGGSGSIADPFLISNATDLNNVRYYPDIYCYKQTADIDLGISPWNEGSGWEPIGYYKSDDDYEVFKGIYDGNNYKIMNLTINRSEDRWVGLFGYVSMNNLKNINLNDVYVKGGNEATGPLVGLAWYGTIENCFSSGTITGSGFVGGLVGFCHGIFKNCGSSCNVNSSESYAGGIVGISNNTSILRCYASGNVSGKTYAGGLIGWAYNMSVIKDCYARGNVNGDKYCGGFTGKNSNSNISNSYSTGNVSTLTEPAGGFSAADSSGTFTSCYWDTETSGQSASAGGIGKTTDDMTYLFGADTYSGWDFTTTWVGSYNNNDAYPHLAWQGLTAIEEESGLPKVTALHQNYPNPFNPTTEIKFDLIKDSDVSLSVYNSNGQLVKELVKDNMSAGYHNVTFDAAGLNSGLYFYRLNYGDKAITRKMILVK